MGGFFGMVAKRDAIEDTFFGVDYHSHLGTRCGGMAAKRCLPISGSSTTGRCRTFCPRRTY